MAPVVSWMTIFVEVTAFVVGHYDARDNDILGNDIIVSWNGNAVL